MPLSSLLLDMHFGFSQHLEDPIHRSGWSGNVCTHMSLHNLTFLTCDMCAEYMFCISVIAVGGPATCAYVPASFGIIDRQCVCSVHVWDLGHRSGVVWILREHVQVRIHVLAMSRTCFFPCKR